MIQVEKLSKTYRRGHSVVAALKDATFNIAPGDFVCVRGASGSGKSTLLNLLGCLDRSTSGSYRLDGEDVTRHSDRQLSRLRNSKIGFVFQSFNLLARTTALENVEIPMIYGDGRVDRKRAHEALTRVGLAARANHFPTELSGGEQQRVAIARALINHPSLILADEPTGNLDQNAAREIMNLLRSLHDEGRTILIVTHDPSVARYAEREIILQDGAVIADRSSDTALPGSVQEAM